MPRRSPIIVDDGSGQVRGHPLKGTRVVLEVVLFLGLWARNRARRLRALVAAVRRHIKCAYRHRRRAGGVTGTAHPHPGRGNVLICQAPGHSTDMINQPPSNHNSRVRLLQGQPSREPVKSAQGELLGGGMVRIRKLLGIDMQRNKSIPSMSLIALFGSPALLVMQKGPKIDCSSASCRSGDRQFKVTAIRVMECRERGSYTTTSCIAKGGMYYK